MWQRMDGWQIDDNPVYMQILHLYKLDILPVMHVF